jgi:hypothetical protein
MMYVRIFVAMSAFIAVIWALVEARVLRTGRVMRRELAAAGDRIELGPVRCSLRGDLPKQFDMGMLALTDRRLVFYRTVGTPISIPRDDLASARPEKWYRHARRFGEPHLVVTTHSGMEYGFMVKRTTRWLTALASGSS